MDAYTCEILTVFTRVAGTKGGYFHAHILTQRSPSQSSRSGLGILEIGSGS